MILCDIPYHAKKWNLGSFTSLIIRAKKRQTHPSARSSGKVSLQLQQAAPVLNRSTLLAELRLNSDHAENGYPNGYPNGCKGIGREPRDPKWSWDTSCQVKVGWNMLKLRQLQVQMESKKESSWIVKYLEVSYVSWRFWKSLLAKGFTILLLSHAKSHRSQP
jgi:hypothetical protein